MITIAARGNDGGAAVAHPRNGFQGHFLKEIFKNMGMGGQTHWQRRNLGQHILGHKCTLWCSGVGHQYYCLQSAPPEHMFGHSIFTKN